MLIQQLIVVAVLSMALGQQLKSPCPEVLRYEPRKPDEPDKWYGVITVGSDHDLEGVWIKVFLDKEALLLGNWFSDAISTDNKLFSIGNPQYKLMAGPPILVRFFVQYDTDEAAPQVLKILLNGKTVCSRTRTTTTEPTLHLSFGNREPGTEGNRLGGPHQHPNREPGVRGSNAKRPSTTPSSREEDNFYGGDFTRANKPPTSRPSRKTAECGTVAQRAAPLITHGESTSPGQWPWHVALYRFTGTELKYTCGATLISERHLVTAAHCVTKPRTTNPVQKDKLVVYLGKYSLISFGATVQDRQIEAIAVHPEYNASVYFNDIAVLTLSSAIEITDYVRPCCLWSEESTNLEALVGRKGTVVGWGINESGELSQNLMQIQLPVVSNTDCLLSNRNFFSQFLSHNNFCAGFQNDTAVCNGDSGGGMVFPKNNSSASNAVWQLRGIISLGVARQSESICDPKHYTMLTDAAKHTKWITETIRN